MKLTMENKPWTREELVLALNLYLKLPFGEMYSRPPEIIRLAEIINHSANAVAMRLSNFASVDPYHQQRGIKGLTGGIGRYNWITRTKLVLRHFW